jgi:four helix bundle protein
MNEKIFNLEERTMKFAKDVRSFIKILPKSISNIEDGKQLVRSSGSVGANYIEANESLGKKDFLLRIKISRKEAKESGYWLNLIDVQENKLLKDQKDSLLEESIELMKIFSSIMRKSI